MTPKQGRVHSPWLLTPIMAVTLLAGCTAPVAPAQSPSAGSPPGSLTTVLWKLGATLSESEPKLFTIDDPQLILDRATQLWNDWFFETPGVPDENGEFYNRWPSSGCWFFDPKSGGPDTSLESVGLEEWPDTFPVVFCGPTQLIDTDRAPGDDWSADLLAIDLAEIARIDGDRLVVRDQSSGPDEKAEWGDGWFDGTGGGLNVDSGYRFFRPDGTQTTWAEMLGRIAGEAPEVDPTAVPITAPAFWREALDIGDQVVGFAGVAVHRGRDLPTPTDRDVVAAVDRLAAAVTAFEKAESQLLETWDPSAAGAPQDEVIPVLALVGKVADAYRPLAEKVDVSNGLTDHVDEQAARIDALRSRAGLTDDMLRALQPMDLLNEQVRAAEVRWRPS